jgi:hypothetical protein
LDSFSNEGQVGSLWIFTNVTPIIY